MLVVSQIRTWHIFSTEKGLVLTISSIKSRLSSLLLHTRVHLCHREHSRELEMTGSVL
jgi:hypothetical protein